MGTEVIYNASTGTSKTVVHKDREWTDVIAEAIARQNALLNSEGVEAPQKLDKGAQS